MRSTDDCFNILREKNFVFDRMRNVSVGRGTTVCLTRILQSIAQAICCQCFEILIYAPFDLFMTIHFMGQIMVRDGGPFRAVLDYCCWKLYRYYYVIVVYSGWFSWRLYTALVGRAHTHVRAASCRVECDYQRGYLNFWRHPCVILTWLRLWSFFAYTCAGLRGAREFVSF